MKSAHEPLPTDRDAEGFPSPGAPNSDLLMSMIEAEAAEVRRLEIEIVTNVDPAADTSNATDVVEAAVAAVSITPTPHGTLGHATIPRAQFEPAIDPTVPAPPPIPADNDGWPEGTWVPEHAGGDTGAMPMFTQDELRAALHTPMSDYAVSEDRIKCRTCRHCWQGFAVAPVRSQTQVLFANFRRCLAQSRFIIDLTGTRIVECSQYIPGGIPATKPPEMLARERALGEIP